MSSSQDKTEVIEKLSGKYCYFNAPTEHHHVKLEGNSLAWKKRWEGKTFEANLLGWESGNHFAYTLCCNCFDIRKLPVGNTPDNLLKASLCTPCNSLPLRYRNYHECVYRALLNSPLLGKDFELSFRSSMLSFGYKCSFSKDGSISIGGEISEEIRDNRRTSLEADTGEEDAKSNSLQLALRKTISYLDSIGTPSVPFHPPDDSGSDTDRGASLEGLCDELDGEFDDNDTIP